ncbi:glycoside hydrolase family 3 N-terminal domain-containing protein [Paenibacillus sp. YYML68]|uniref:glycoside hydrolase family 3 N-terminal domain-containing protein n=1 Tax=Paenibacillus sp. YYML68 TaxID=2909250 RepID=UPI0024902C34|nr:glycoside hydrolase family 3 N-terminal domain-containing protein [Paenibacillus sp. YYML68]
MESYKNAALSVDARVEDLLQRMTLAEKVVQTMSIGKVGQTFDVKLNEDGSLADGSIDDIYTHGAGAIQLPFKGDSIETRIQKLNALQSYFVNQTRLGIPVMVHEECLHGHLAKDATSFPIPIAMASTWDTELIERVYSAMSKEARARGGHEAHTPVLDLARDPRWGRTEETYGEDTFLVTRMGVAAVRGLQGDGPAVDAEHVIAAPKHLAGYAQSDGGRNFAPSHIPLRVLQDQILPPFKAVVQEAGALGMMPSHNEIDGIPCHGNRKLLTDTLREDWGFNGIVVSDYFDSSRLDILFHVVSNQKEAAVKALKAGLDMDLPGGGCYIHLLEAVAEDPSLEEVLNIAVARILRAKFLLGLFENPYADADYAKRIINCDSHKKLAKEVADKSITLLKNEGGLLPLQLNKLRKLAVIGPNAHPICTGSYSTKPNKGISILDGIIAKTKGQLEVVYAKGCDIIKGKDDGGETELDRRLNNPQLRSLDENVAWIEEAVQVAKESEVAVVCVGGNTLTSREAIFFNDDRGDRADLNLPGSQDELVKRIVETGTPTVVILINGSPLTINYIAQNVPAILEGWYLGEETGHTVADVLFGDVNPSGKLPITFPRSVGQLPVYYSQKPTGLFKKYLFVEHDEPLFVFGSGLSYTTFEYRHLQLSSSSMTVEGTVTVSIDVSNTGEVAGDEVVQLYITDLVSSVTRPIQELKGFKRITLQPGETKTVSFLIEPSMLSFTDEQYETIVEPGEFKIMVGTSSKQYESVVLNVVPVS